MANPEHINKKFSLLLAIKHRLYKPQQKPYLLKSNGSGALSAPVPSSFCLWSV